MSHTIVALCVAMHSVAMCVVLNSLAMCDIDVMYEYCDVCSSVQVLRCALCIMGDVM